MYLDLIHGTKQVLSITQLKKAISSDIINIFGDGRQTRNFIFVEDLSKIIIKLFKAKSGIYNICSPNSISVNYYLKILKKFFPNIKIVKKPFNKGEVKNVFISNSKLMKTLVLKKNNFTKFDNAIYKTFKWYKNN